MQQHRAYEAATPCSQAKPKPTPTPTPTPNQARLLEEGKAHVASEIASQARIASLTKQLEASRAEAAEMQDRLMGFEGERRKLEARDTHIHMYMPIGRSLSCTL